MIDIECWVVSSEHNYLHFFRFGVGTGKIWLNYLQCTASDTKLISCAHRGVGIHYCGHNEDIAVYCTGKDNLTFKFGK